MLARFARDSLIYGAGTLLSSAARIALLPIYARLLSPSDFGIIDLVAISGALVGLVIPLEISQATARFYPEATNEAERQGVASTALWFTLATFSLFLGVAVLGRAWLGPWLFGDASSPGIVCVGALSIWSWGIFYFTHNQLRWQLQPRRHATLSAVNIIVSPLLAGVLIVVCGWKASGVLAAQWVSNIVSTILALYWTQRDYRFVFDTTVLRKLLRFSTPLVVSGIGVFAATYIDRIAIKEMLSLDDLGRYSISFRVASMATIVVTALQTSLVPLIFSHYRDPGTPAAIAHAFRHCVFLLLLILVGLAFFSPEMLTVLTAPQYVSLANLVPILAAANLLNLMYMFAPGLPIAGRTGRIAIINIAAALGNGVLTIVLIPRWGIAGAATATLIAAAGSFAITMSLSQQTYPVPHAWRRVVAASVIASGTIALVVIQRDNSMASVGIGLLNRSLSFAGVGAILGCVLINSSDLQRLSRAMHSRLRTSGMTKQAGAAISPLMAIKVEGAVASDQGKAND